MKKSEFNKLSKAEKRVVIAKDALAQLRLNKWSARMGLYVQFGNGINVANKENAQLCKILPKGGKCEVCARGALFLSAVRKFNDFKVSQLELAYEQDEVRDIGSYEFRKYELGFFTRAQIKLIEAAFEGYDFISSSWPKAVQDGCRHFYENFTTQTRLEAILKNIVRNKGTFKPQDQY